MRTAAIIVFGLFAVATTLLLAGVGQNGRPRPTTLERPAAIATDIDPRPAATSQSPE